jgi:hypothetical protein
LTESERQVTVGGPGGTASESLSQLLARILDQLSVSAWLPAGALVFIVLFYANLRIAKGDPVRAIQAISSMGWGSLVLVVGAIVLATMISQAFEFGAIRLLEGYWGTWWFASELSDLGCAVHIWQRDRLTRTKNALEDEAFARARTRMRVHPELRVIADILEARRLDEAMPVHSSDSDRQSALEHRWVDWARAKDVRRLNELTRRLKGDYPEVTHRVLPTRFGNVIRIYEDRVHTPGSGSLSGLVQRVFHELPFTLQLEHDQFRSRLNLYCSMVIVFVLAAVAAVPALGWSDWRAPAITAAVALAMALLSYQAAIASARAYGTVLETIGSVVESRSTESAPATTPSGPAPAES